MIGPDAETLLREALTAQTQDVRPPTDFVNATIDHSVASLRTTHRRRLAVGAGALAAVFALATWQGPSILRSEPDHATTQPQQSDQGPAFAWASSLPRGAEADVAYAVRSTLVIGSTSLQLDPGSGADQFDLLATLPGGWLADRWSPAGGPYQTSDTYGLLRPDGAFFPYDAQSAVTTVSGAAASPDGTEVAYRGLVVRTGFTASGFDPAAMGHDVVADLPVNARAIVDWTSSGLLYRDKQEHFWLWTPGSAPVRQPYDSAVPGGYGVVSQGDCVDVSRIGLESSTYRLCGHGEPLTVSTGKRALTTDGEFTNLEAGVDFLSLPTEVVPEQLQLFWESDDSLILVVQDASDGTNSTLLVRCSVTAGLCERASESLASYPQIAAIPRSGR